jgi:hypothetical protein
MLKLILKLYSKVRLFACLLKLRLDDVRGVAPNVLFIVVYDQLLGYQNVSKYRNCNFRNRFVHITKIKLFSVKLMLDWIRLVGCF